MMLDGYSDPTFPGYLGNKVYLVVTAYPSEGTSIRVDMVNKNTQTTPFATVNYTIPAGTTPFMVNYTCDQCYAMGQDWYTYVTYANYEDVLYQFGKDITLGIQSASVEALDTSLTASITGLTVGVNYYVMLTCELNSAVWGKNFAADSTAKTISEITGIKCAGQKYLILSSGDEVHKTNYTLSN